MALQTNGLENPKGMTYWEDGGMPKPFIS